MHGTATVRERTHKLLSLCLARPLHGEFRRRPLRGEFVGVGVADLLGIRSACLMLTEEFVVRLPQRRLTAMIAEIFRIRVNGGDSVSVGIGHGAPLNGNQEVLKNPLQDSALLPPGERADERTQAPRRVVLIQSCPGPAGGSAHEEEAHEPRREPGFPAHHHR